MRGRGQAVHRRNSQDGKAEKGEKWIWGGRRGLRNRGMQRIACSVKKRKKEQREKGVQGKSTRGERTLSGGDCWNQAGEIVEEQDGRVLVNLRKKIRGGGKDRVALGINI